MPNYGESQAKKDFPKKGDVEDKVTLTTRHGVTITTKPSRDRETFVSHVSHMEKETTEDA